MGNTPIRLFAAALALARLPLFFLPMQRLFLCAWAKQSSLSLGDGGVLPVASSPQLLALAPASPLRIHSAGHLALLRSRCAHRERCGPVLSPHQRQNAAQKTLPNVGTGKT